MQDNKAADRRQSGTRLRHSWPLLVSLFGVNLPLLGLLGLMSGHARQSDLAVIVPVTLIEIPDKVEPEPEPVPPPETIAPAPAPSAPAPPEPKSPEIDRPTLQSPIVAAPGEVADANMPEPGPDNDAADMTPTIREPTQQAVTALKAFRCNRLGADRPADCDSIGDAVTPVTKPAFAEEPDMKSKAWADFELQQPDLALARILAEGCPPNDGVINDVFVPTDNPYLQGAASMVGSLSANSAKPECG